RGKSLAEGSSIAEHGSLGVDVPAADISGHVHEAGEEVTEGDWALFDSLARLDQRPYSAVFGSGEDQPKLPPLPGGDGHRDASTGEFSAKARPSRKAKKRA